MAWDDFLKAEAWRNAMANLLKKGEEVGSYIEQAPGKAGQAILDAGQRQQALMNEAFDPTGKTLIRNPQAANKAAMNLLEGPLGFMPAGITAWHGSPHTFEKFDMSKVGTGEGAQAYGHGMYFAEAPAVAEGYKEALKGKDQDIINNAIERLVHINNKDTTKIADALKLEGFNAEKITPELQNSIKKIVLGTDPTNNVVSKSALNEYANLSKLVPEQGNLYKVDIPDEHIPTMMDWDKPLGQQSAFVKKAINNLKKQVTPEMKMELGGDLNLLFGKDITPNQFLNTWEIIHPTGGTGIGEKLLNEQGVKGIRYLDNASRDAGKGTSNFVVFDPTDVKILERNNQPLTRKEILEKQVNKLK